MTSIILAWLVGEGLMIYHDVQRNHRPPLPAELLSTSGLFVLLALLGEPYPQLASILSWGFVSAAFLALYSGASIPGTTSSAPPTTTVGM